MLTSQLTAIGQREELVEGLAERLTEAIADTTASEIFFAALSLPGDSGNDDLSTVTLAASSLKSSAQDKARRDEQGAHVDYSGLPPTNTQPGATQNALQLSIGDAARSERTYILEIGSPVPPLPVLCVEYAVAIPDDERALILTFTSIAPSDIGTLRGQFADIAATLMFA